MSSLGSDETVQPGHIGLSGDVDSLTGRRPVKCQPVTRVTEDASDVRRHLLECVPRPRPLCAGVVEATAVRVNQSCDQTLRPPIDQALLPVGEDDPTGVLLSGSMLRKQARPVRPLGVHLDAVPGLVLTPDDAGPDGKDRRDRTAEDAGVFAVH